MTETKNYYIVSLALIISGVILVLVTLFSEFLVIAELYLYQYALASILVIVGIVVSIAVYIISFWIWHRINFIMQQQQCGQWCWAAAAVSVCAFFNPNQTWTQCSLVNAEFNRPDCCVVGCSQACNQPWYLSNALQRTGNYVALASGVCTMNQIKQEIDNNRPLCVRIEWNGGGGHIVAIDGYNQSLDMVAVDDPSAGSSDIDLTIFQTAYQGVGTWTHSYWVGP